MDALAELKQTFLEECDELLTALEDRLLSLEQGSMSADDVNAAFRAIHSIKGGAGAFGFNSLVEISHVFEAGLDQVRSGRIALDGAPFPLFLRAADTVAGLVAAVREERSVPVPVAMIEELKQIGQASAAQPASAPSVAPPPPAAVAVEQDTPQAAEPVAAEPVQQRHRILFTFEPDVFRRAVEPRAIFGGLEEFGLVTVRCLTHALPPLAAMDPLSCYLTFEVEVETRTPEATISAMLEVQLTPEEYCFQQGGDTLSAGGDDWAAPGLSTLTLVANDAGPLPAWDEAGASWDEAPAVQADPSLAPEIQMASDAVDPVHSETSDDGWGTTPPVSPPASATPAPVARPVALPGAKGVKQKQGGSIRVDLDRIDKLMNLVGEIVITQSMLDQRLLSLSALEAVHIAEGLQVLVRQTRELQESVMSVRAQPVRNVFQRMPRLVRELAQSLGKDVRIVVHGEDTEVDKTIIEELSDPLTHMIRNSMDHGIEPGEERLAAGKPAEGTITLKAEQRGGRIVITVSDDGRGINREKLLAKARERGLLTPEARPQPEEIDALIFHPGLSTAEKVTDVSGRGVGMDVVKQNVEALGGRIMVISEPGRGSRFTLLLPLTLAVMDGMIIRAGGERFVLPIASIVETIQFAGTKVESLPNGQEFLRLRDKLSPLVRLGPALGLPSHADEQIIIMTETDGGERLGLAVEEIVSQQQVVVKSLEASYGRVPGASAATILGDGLVALIIDVDSLPMLPAGQKLLAQVA